MCASGTKMNSVITAIPTNLHAIKGTRAYFNSEHLTFHSHRVEKLHVRSHIPHMHIYIAHEHSSDKANGNTIPLEKCVANDGPAVGNRNV